MCGCDRTLCTAVHTVIYWVDGQASGPGGDPKAGCAVGADANSTREAKYWPSAGGEKEMRRVDDVRGCMLYCSGKTYAPNTEGPLAQHADDPPEC